MITEKKLKKNDTFVFISTLNTFCELNVKIKNNFENLLSIDQQKKQLLSNTLAFSENKLYHHALLWGEKGMGKSSLIRGIHTYCNQKLGLDLKLLEIFNSDIKYLPEIIYKINKFQYKCIIFLDDITFNSSSLDFKVFKTIVDGSSLSNCNKVIFYTTSNIRNLVKPLKNSEYNDLEIKDHRNNFLALKDRFGLSLGFYKCNKIQYLKIINNYFKHSKIEYDQNIINQMAMAWSIEKGGFSGRIAYQFFVDFLIKNKIQID